MTEFCDRSTHSPHTHPRSTHSATHTESSASRSLLRSSAAAPPRPQSFTSQSAACTLCTTRGSARPTSHSVPNWVIIPAHRSPVIALLDPFRRIRLISRPHHAHVFAPKGTSSLPRGTRAPSRSGSTRVLRARLLDGPSMRATFRQSADGVLGRVGGITHLHEAACGSRGSQTAGHLAHRPRWTSTRRPCRSHLRCLR